MKKFGQCPICNTVLTRGNTTLGPVSILYKLENGIYSIDKDGPFRMRVRICSNCFKNIEQIDGDNLVEKLYKGYNTDSPNTLSKLKKKKKKDIKVVSDKVLDRKITEYINDGKSEEMVPSEAAKKKQKRGFWALFKR